MPDDGCQRVVDAVEKITGGGGGMIITVSKITGRVVSAAPEKKEKNTF